MDRSCHDPVPPFNNAKDNIQSVSCLSSHFLRDQNSKESERVWKKGSDWLDKQVASCWTQFDRFQMIRLKPLVDLCGATTGVAYTMGRRSFRRKRSIRFMPATASLSFLSIPPVILWISFSIRFIFLGHLFDSSLRWERDCIIIRTENYTGITSVTSTRTAYKPYHQCVEECGWKKGYLLSIFCVAIHILRQSESLPLKTSNDPFPGLTFKIMHGTKWLDDQREWKEMVGGCKDSRAERFYHHPSVLRGVGLFRMKNVSTHCMSHILSDRRQLTESTECFLTARNNPVCKKRDRHKRIRWRTVALMWGWSFSKSLCTMLFVCSRSISHEAAFSGAAMRLCMLLISFIVSLRTPCTLLEQGKTWD